MWKRFLFILTACTCALLFLLPAAHADDESRREAMDLVRVANQQYDAGDFRAAIIRYRRAWELTRDSRILYRVGLTWEHLANYKLARQTLEEFLKLEPDSEFRGRIEAKLVNLKRLEESMQAYVTVTSEPAGARVYLDEDGQSYGTTPLTIPLGPGEWIVRVVAPTQDARQFPIRVEPGESLERHVEFSPVERATVDPDHPTPSDPEEPAPVQMMVATGEVDIAPSAGMNALGWTALLAGSITLATMTAAYQVFGLIVGVVVAGPLIGAGAFILWGYDWSSRLDDGSFPEPTDVDIDGGAGFNLQLRF